MPEWAQFKKEYCLEPWHLPVSHGPNVAVIEGLDSEEAVEQETGETYLRHLLVLAGWTLPLRLRNELIDTLQALFGPRSEDAIGKKICLIAGTRTSWGKTVPCINIMPVLPPADARPVSPLPRLRVATRLRLETASNYGVPLFEDRPALNLSPMGDLAAERLRSALQAHGKKFEDVLRYLKAARPELVEPCVGVELRELPIAALKPIGEYFATLGGGATAQPTSTSAALPVAPAATSPPVSTQASAVDLAPREQVDKATGEVIDPTSIPGVRRGVAPEFNATRAAANANKPPVADDDDIPF